MLKTDRNIHLSIWLLLGVNSLHIFDRPRILITVSCTPFAGHEDVVQALIEHGAKVEAEDNRKRTPLHRAANQGRSFNEWFVHAFPKEDYRFIWSFSLNSLSLLSFQAKTKWFECLLGLALKWMPKTKIKRRHYILQLSNVNHSHVFTNKTFIQLSVSYVFFRRSWRCGSSSACSWCECWCWRQEKKNATSSRI